MANETNVDGLTFQQWLNAVNESLYELSEGVFCHHQDLADFNSWDCWDSGMSPEEGAMECMENDSIGQQVIEEFGL